LQIHFLDTGKLNNWKNALGYLAAKFNMTNGVGDFRSPYEIVFGRKPKKDSFGIGLEEDVKGQIEIRHKRFKIKEKLKSISSRAGKELKVGDAVWWILSPKDNPGRKFTEVSGPFIVIEICGENSFILEDIENKSTKKVDKKDLWFCKSV
jgi:hypothetical protein